MNECMFLTNACIGAILTTFPFYFERSYATFELRSLNGIGVEKSAKSCAEM